MRRFNPYHFSRWTRCQAIVLVINALVISALGMGTLCGFCWATSLTHVTTAPVKKMPGAVATPVKKVPVAATVPVKSSATATKPKPLAQVVAPTQQPAKGLSKAQTLQPVAPSVKPTYEAITTSITPAAGPLTSVHAMQSPVETPTAASDETNRLATAPEPPLAKSDTPTLFSVQSATIQLKSVTPEEARQSGQSNAISLTLPVLVELVMQQNLDLSIAKSRFALRKAEYINSFAGLMPSVRGQLFLERFTGSDIIISETPVSVNRTTFRPRMFVDYPVSLGGKPIFQIRAAHHAVASERESKAQAAQKALLEATDAYFHWLRCHADVQLLQAGMQDTETQVEVNEKRLLRGFGTRYEVEQAKVQKAERETELLHARNQEQVAAYALSNILNLPYDTVFTVETPTIMPVQFIPVDATLPDLMSQATQHRPELKRLTEEIKSLRALYHAAFSDLLPTLTLSGYYGGIGPPDKPLRETFQRGISLNMDMLRNMGVGTLANIRANRARLEEGIQLREKQRNQMQQDLATAFTDWQYQASVIRVTQQKLDAAKEAYRLADARRQSGFGIQLEVLTAQTQLNTALREVQAAIKAFNSAQLSLLFEMGQLTPERLL